METERDQGYPAHLDLGSPASYQTWLNLQYSTNGTSISTQSGFPETAMLGNSRSSQRPTLRRHASMKSLTTSTKVPNSEDMPPLPPAPPFLSQSKLAPSPTSQADNVKDGKGSHTPPPSTNMAHMLPSPASSADSSPTQQSNLTSVPEGSASTFADGSPSLSNVRSDSLQRELRRLSMEIEDWKKRMETKKAISRDGGQGRTRVVKGGDEVVEHAEFSADMTKAELDGRADWRQSSAYLDESSIISMYNQMSTLPRSGFPITLIREPHSSQSSLDRPPHPTSTTLPVTSAATTTASHGQAATSSPPHRLSFTPSTMSTLPYQFSTRERPHTAILGAAPESFETAWHQHQHLVQESYRMAADNDFHNRATLIDDGTGKLQYLEHQVQQQRRTSHLQAYPMMMSPEQQYVHANYGGMAGMMLPPPPPGTAYLPPGTFMVPPSPMMHQSPYGRMSPMPLYISTSQPQQQHPQQSHQHPPSSPIRAYPSQFSLQTQQPPRPMDVRSSASLPSPTDLGLDYQDLSEEDMKILVAYQEFVQSRNRRSRGSSALRKAVSQPHISWSHAGAENSKDDKPEDSNSKNVKQSPKFLNSQRQQQKPLPDVPSFTKRLSKRLSAQSSTSSSSSTAITPTSISASMTNADEIVVQKSKKEVEEDREDMFDDLAAIFDRMPKTRMNDQRCELPKKTNNNNHLALNGIDSKLASLKLEADDDNDNYAISAVAADENGDADRNDNDHYRSGGVYSVRNNYGESKPMKPRKQRSMSSMTMGMSLRVPGGASGKLSSRKAAIMHTLSESLRSLTTPVPPDEEEEEDEEKKDEKDVVGKVEGNEEKKVRLRPATPVESGANGGDSSSSIVGVLKRSMGLTVK
ncbi:hypothetical protein HDV05_007030, partial [Chytridiales sp. JEL 0842]